MLAALKGILDNLRHENHFRIHILALLILIPLGLWLRLSPQEWAILLLCCGLILATEAGNTALERLADALHPDHHPLVGRAKDSAAAAVLLSAVISVTIGLLILLPKLIGKLS